LNKNTKKGTSYPVGNSIVDIFYILNLIEVILMTTCHEMKEGETYECEDCGLEIKVIHGCECCSTEDDSECCRLECCGKPLKKE